MITKKHDKWYTTFYTEDVPVLLIVNGLFMPHWWNYYALHRKADGVLTSYYNGAFKDWFIKGKYKCPTTLLEIGGFTDAIMRDCYINLGWDVMEDADYEDLVKQAHRFLVTNNVLLNTIEINPHEF